jgi:hypothetical protein
VSWIAQSRRRFREFAALAGHQPEQWHIDAPYEHALHFVSPCFDFKRRMRINGPGPAPRNAPICRHAVPRLPNSPHASSIHVKIPRKTRP